MSRETDTPSSGPNGRGGAAYPSGTPPYGTPMASDDGADAGRSGARSEERKTETTLTTRIRINIPGSRPIPPVVVRKPVADGESADGERDDAPAAEVSAPAAPAPAPEAAAAPAAPAEEKTSDWFAPRKAGAPAKGGASANGAGNPGGSGAPAGAPGARPGAQGTGNTAGGTGARPGGVVGSMSVPGRNSGKTNGSGLPGATGGPVAPGHGGGTGSFDVTEALAAGPLGGGSRSPDASGGEPRRDDLPYFTENGTAGGQDPFGTAGAGGANGMGGQGGQGGRGGSRGPAGPTGGPVTGDSPLRPGAEGPFGHQGAERGALTGIADLDGPAGVPGAGLGPGGGLSDDTAILTPQKPAPEPGTPGYRAPDNVSGHTVTSGIPVVPAGNGAPFGTGAPGGPGGPAAPAAPKPEPAAAAPKEAAKPKKKGRSKLVLLCVGLVVLAGGVYGAGLLMNHTDVPKGTTVLGVDVGGGTRDDAVKKLDDVFGSRVTKPLKLSVGGRTVMLTPANAGLQFDFQATASAAAKSDYNPVSVVGTLFGQQRVVEPVMPVDEEKLQAALQQAGGGSGSGAVVDGGITFEAGKAVAVHGKAGTAIDAARSTQTIEQAFRTEVETGEAATVTVPTVKRQPTVSDAEVDREMKEFAEPAMSAKVTVMTDSAHAVAMSPQNSLWKFLRVTAVNGKLVDKPDLAALKQLYGKTFDGVLIARGNGQKTPVTPQDVYGALRQALTSRTNRVAVISTNPN
ncbi:hypothetical protein [Streptomyces malaysiense]|uniref:Peptidoglycan binding domain-containing protein n=1 Tax=Streptomyces malaysiense TaxID=1428626 RepID=A0A1J4Q236_9ACTN|nr:hypothetical protein [Streptomyces malaysiense]OIK26446.1 hypothetical protein VT52_016700 [Streptomyces malaysiense]